MRHAGILLHISSLPTGTMGRCAYAFADFLKAAGQHYWQILPLGPTGYGNSPYQSLCTYAGNPAFIDRDLLVEEGLVLPEEGEHWLEAAFLRGREQMEQFRRENPWVEDYGLFMAVREARGGECWADWPEELRRRTEGGLNTYAIAYSERIQYYIFVQYLFYKQWNALRDYVHALGLELIGDLPIYVPYDSCDVWLHPELFQLDEEGRPTAVAGCPPDAFSEDGQLWGNPLYRWEKMKEDDFAWWRSRLQAVQKQVDVIRIDHFRGLESYWSVPFGEETAKNGKWCAGPASAFLESMQRNLPNLRCIAEDLGFLTPEVLALRAESGWPGMKILQFAFDAPCDYLPHRYEPNCICYTGTHDNETLIQWLAGVGEVTRENLAAYLGADESRWAEALIRLGMGSVADTFIAPMQDYLGLGEEGRMNTPGTCGPENWAWRMEDTALTEELASALRQLVIAYER